MGYSVAVGHSAVGMLMSRAGIAGLPGNRRRRRKPPGPPTAMDAIRVGGTKLWERLGEFFDSVRSLKSISRSKIEG